MTGEGPRAGQVGENRDAGGSEGAGMVPQCRVCGLKATCS